MSKIHHKAFHHQVTLLLNIITFTQIQGKLFT